MTNRPKDAQKNANESFGASKLCSQQNSYREKDAGWSERTWKSGRTHLGAGGDCCLLACFVLR